MKYPNYNKGFTLVEMLISLSIFAIITAFATANFNVARQGDEVRLASQLVASSLRRAQTSATAGETTRFCRGGSNDLKVCPTGLDSECSGGGVCVREVPTGYGQHFTLSGADTRKVIFFADIDGDKAYDVGEEIRRDGISPGAFVSISAMSPLAGNDLDVVFVPPKPTAYFNGSTADATASLTLRHSTTAATRTVTINRISGQISAD